MSSAANPSGFGALLNEIRARPTIPGGVSDTKSDFHIEVSGEYTDATVKRVIAVCTRSDDHDENGVQRVGYYFRLFCAISEEKSVEFQAFRISASSGICRVFAKERPYASTNKNLVAEHRMPCSTESTFTAKQVVEYVIHEKKRYQYTYDKKTGSGCRYWCNVVVQDLEELGLLPPGSASGMVEWGDGVARSDPEWMPEKAVEGTFY